VLTHTESKAVLRVSKTKKKAFAYADRFIADHHREKLYAIDASARWRSTPASDKQLDLIAKLSRGTEIPENISKGDASLLIDTLMLAKKARRETKAS
jgi:hypothetical protein